MSVSKGRKLKNPVELPYLRVANVQRGYLDLETIKTMMVEADRVESLLLQNGDVLFNEGGDLDKLGRGWVWEDQIKNCTTQNHVYWARPLDKDALVPKFISMWGNSFGRDYFETKGKQTTNLASINRSVLKSFPIPIPPSAEQHQIVAEVEARTTAIDHLEAELDRQITRSNRLRQSVLSEAFQGKLN